jgi:hypothetical protein
MEGRCRNCGKPTVNLGGECTGCIDDRHGVRRRRRPARADETNTLLTPEQQAEVDARIEREAARVAAELERLNRKGI